MSPSSKPSGGKTSSTGNWKVGRPRKNISWPKFVEIPPNASLKETKRIQNRNHQRKWRFKQTHLKPPDKIEEFYTNESQRVWNQQTSTQQCPSTKRTTTTHVSSSWNHSHAWSADDGKPHKKSKKLGAEWSCVVKENQKLLDLFDKLHGQGYDEVIKNKEELWDQVSDFVLSLLQYAKLLMRRKGTN